MSNPKHLVTNCIILVAAILLVLPGCKINVKKDADDKEKRVDISTPLGGIHVSKGADPRDLGLPIYPGARARAEHDNDDKGANVNISSPYFGLKVVAQEFESDDSPDKLVHFYTDELKKYGKVIECHGKWKGQNAKVSAGHHSGKHSEQVTCDKDSSGDAIELKVGTEENQHLVAIESQGKGCKFALVRVELRHEDETI
jgi:hypothetical protein